MSIFGNSIFGFLIAILILVTIHEFGHFWVARRAGVKVLEFAVGFGKPIWTFYRKNDPTQYSIRMIPLGGYVKMLDERETNVPQHERHMAFNHKSPKAKAAIVFAGPLANFIFAFVAMWAVFVIGDTDAPVTIEGVAKESIATEYGFQSGQKIVAIDGKSMRGWSQHSLYLTNKALSQETVVFTLQDLSGSLREVQVPMSAIADLARGPVLYQLGLTPESPGTKLSELVDAGPAQLAGLKPGDQIIEINNTAVNNWRELVQTVAKLPDQAIVITVMRDGITRQFDVITQSRLVEGQQYGQIGVYRPQYENHISYSAISAMGASLEHNYLMLAVNLKGIWQMLTGQMSLKNISGAITIAQVAGHTVESGFNDFLRFLALISFSLGIINLLPIPILDGGHLMYIAYEAVSGRAPNEKFMLLAQQIGLFLIIMLMSLALFNDVTRLFAIN